MPQSRGLPAPTSGRWLAMAAVVFLTAAHAKADYLTIENLSTVRMGFVNFNIAFEFSGDTNGDFVIGSPYPWGLPSFILNDIDGNSGRFLQPGATYTSPNIPQLAGAYWLVGINFNGNTGISGHLLSPVCSDPALCGAYTFVINGVMPLLRVTFYRGSPNLDTTPPAISGLPVQGCKLWPPNGRLVQVATISANDTQSGLDSLTVSASSNEPSTDAQDIVITPAGINQFSVQLRADRLGQGGDRVYTIVTVATDRAGNKATATGICTVPHDQGH